MKKYEEQQGLMMSTVRNYWWVNQNQTYKEEITGGFLWSPKRKSDGSRNIFYENMTKVQPGDIVFSFAKGFISNIGIVQKMAETAPKPIFGSSTPSWSNEGWIVEVEYTPLKNPIRPKDRLELLLPFLPAKYSPLQPNGNGLQSVYLAEVPENMALVLGELIGSDFDEIVATNLSPAGMVAEADDEVEKQLEERKDIGALEIQQLIKARRGQGIFKSNVRLFENKCRVTGIDNPIHLRASHIKPWRVCSDAEKISGANGLLLAPHIDHLFDQGFISFNKDGEILISPALDKKVLECWSIDPKNVGRFTVEQCSFLDYHHQHIFRA